jgi:hypothetical protein
LWLDPGRHGGSISGRDIISLSVKFGRLSLVVCVLRIRQQLRLSNPCTSESRASSPEVKLCGQRVRIRRFRSSGRSPDDSQGLSNE